MGDIIETSVLVLFSFAQNLSIVVGSAVSGSLSLFGSILMVLSIARDWKIRKLDVKYRYLLGLCGADILTSGWYIVFTVPMRRDVSPNALWALGNITTCEIQGFILQLTGIGMFYNGALSHWFYCSICHSMTSKQYQEAGYERRWHFLSLVYPLFGSIVAVSTQHMNYTPLGCWIGAYPYGCLHDDTVACERGENWVILAWTLMGIPLSIMLLVVAYYMIQIYRYVTNVIGKAQAQIMRLASVNPDDEDSMSNITRPSVFPANNRSSMSQNDGASVSVDASVVKSEQHADRPPNKTSTKSTGDSSIDLPTTLQQSYDKMEFRKRQSSQQAYWYIGVYLITHVFSLFVGISDQAGFPSQFWLQFLANVFWPIQGFGNLCVFLKPRVAAMKRQFPTISTIYIIYCSLFYFDDRTQQLKADAIQTSPRVRTLLQSAVQDDNLP